MSVVNNLKNSVKQGARANKFSLDIPINSVLKGVSGINKILNATPLIGDWLDYTDDKGMSSTSVMRNLRVLAKATTLPGKEVLTTTVWDRGHKYIIRDVSNFSNRWTVTFYNTVDLNLRGLFEHWMYELDRYDHLTFRTPYVTNNFGTSKPKLLNALNPGYMVDIDVTQLDCGSSIGANFRLFHCFPVELGEIQMDMSTTNTITSFEVTFAYSYWNRIWD